MKKRNRTYNLSHIKQNQSYSVEEICDLFGMHKNTVREWLRKGLPKIDDGKPIFIHGSELREYLVTTRQSRKRQCKTDEFYCFRCRHPRRPWGGVVDIIFSNRKVINLSALCEQCDCPLNRRVAVRDLLEIVKCFAIQTVGNQHIIETLPPSLKCYLEGKCK